MQTKLIFLLLTCSLVLGEYDKKKKTLRLEIHRKKTPLENYLNHGHLLDNRIHSELMKKKGGGGKRDNDSIALFRYLDNEFYTPVILGHPAQTVNAALDTTWSYTWFLSSKCSSVKAMGCWFHNLYDHSKSSEYKPDGRPFNLNSKSFNMSGFFSYENITFAHSNVTNQLFIEVVSVPNSYILDKADGVMGLGLKTDPNYDPFFYTDKQSNRGGNVMLGLIDVKHIHKIRVKNETIFDNFTYLSVDDSSYWQFKMDQVVLDGTQKNVILCGKGCKAVADTSGNSIYGPTDDVFKIHDLMNAREFFYGRYTVDCDTINKLPKIDFILGGKNFTLSGPDYTVKMSVHSITMCLSAFIPVDDDRWILGGAFLSQFYSVYNVDDKTVGFVKAN